MNIPKLEKVKVRDIQYKIGDIKNGYEVLPLEKRKKILLLSDDMRMYSGIANISKQLVFGTAHHFNYVQLGAAISHPEYGKVVDVSSDVALNAQISNASVKIYSNNGYGNPTLLRNLIERENPDGIVHFTDPRQWIWLYEMEHEIRQHIPLMYLNIWDSPPDPQYNETFYASCDLLMAISKQTYGINKRVMNRFGKTVIDVNNVTKESKYDSIISYVPHGIDNKLFRKIDDTDDEYKKYKSLILKNHTNKKFIILWNNRNIKRKNPGDVILSYRAFCDMKNVNSDECLLIMHTSIIDENGTDLARVCEALCPNYDVIFIEQHTPPTQMPYLYNLADVTLNIASNEGFGLATAESIMCETPIIVNVTGGLQDQCGFKNENGEYLSANDYCGDWASNHDGKYKNCGDWVIPIFPSNRSLNGSVLTPYISDDRCNFEDVAVALYNMYKLNDTNRKRIGKLGREYFNLDSTMLNSDNMCDIYTKSLNITMENFKTKHKFTLSIINKGSYSNKPVNMLNYNLEGVYE